MITFFGIILGLVYTNFIEWGAHQFLHWIGKKSSRGDILFFHTEHHRLAILFDFSDNDWSFQELIGILMLSAAHSWILLVWPAFYLGAFIGGMAYYFLHRLAHFKPELGKIILPWHWKHHMETPKQNWCVTYPLWDLILRTYK